MRDSKCNGSIDVPLGHIKEIKKARSGRVCKTRGCRTRLSQYNRNDYCHVCMSKRTKEGLYR